MLMTLEVSGYLLLTKMSKLCNNRVNFSTLTFTASVMILVAITVASITYCMFPEIPWYYMIIQSIFIGFFITCAIQLPFTINSFAEVFFTPVLIELKKPCAVGRKAIKNNCITE